MVMLFRQQVWQLNLNILKLQAEMQLQMQAIQKQEEEEIEKINQQLKTRAEKFGSEFVPITKATYNLYKIQKASETGNMKYLEGILLDDITDIQERRKKIQQRAERFFPNIKVEPNPDKFFDQKAVPDFTQQNVEIRYNAYYLFGVDYMSNEKIRHYFNINPHFRIQWINDSSCNIVFNSPEQAEASVKPFVKGDSMKDEKEEIWYELQQYDVEGVKRKLYCRLATNRDSKPKEHHGHNSKYYRWEINKQKINSFVKKRAKQEIYKTKKIHHHQAKISAPKKEQEESNREESSSGLDSQGGADDMKE